MPVVRHSSTKKAIILGTDRSGRRQTVAQMQAIKLSQNKPAKITLPKPPWENKCNTTIDDPE